MSDSPKLMKILFLFPLLFAFCSLPKGGSGNTHTVSADKEEIVFLTLRISRGEAQKKSAIQLVNITRTEGKMKSAPQRINTYENFLTLEVYEDGVLTQTIIEEHPLRKRVEYSEGEELKTKMVEKNEQEFFIRLQTHGKKTAVKIYESWGGKTDKEELTVINLP